MKGEKCHLLYVSAVISLFVSRVSLRLFWEILKHNTGLLICSISRNYYVAVLDFWSRILFGDDICNSISFFCFSPGVCINWLVSTNETFRVLGNLNFPEMFPENTARQHLRLMDFLLLCFLVWHSQFRIEDVALVVKMLGCSLDTASYTALCILFFEVHSVLPVCSSMELAFLLHWLQHSISLWSGSFCHKSLRVDRRYWLSLSFVTVSTVILAFYCCCWE